MNPVITAILLAVLSSPGTASVAVPPRPKVQDDKERVIKVRVAADEAFRKRMNWKETIRARVKAASSTSHSHQMKCVATRGRFAFPPTTR